MRITSIVIDASTSIVIDAITLFGAPCLGVWYWVLMRHAADGLRRETWAIDMSLGSLICHLLSDTRAGDICDITCHTRDGDMHM